MTDLRMMATMLAQEMVEHNLKNGAQALNKNFIAEDACELAYLIDKKIQGYRATNGGEDISENKIKRLIRESIEQSRHDDIAYRNSPHNPNLSHGVGVQNAGQQPHQP